MSRATLILSSRAVREKACHWIMTAPVNTRVEFKAAKRTTDQNSKLWASLTDIATQVEWHGIRLTPADYKLIFLDALRRELGSNMRIVPNIDGTGFVNIGTSSSDLSKDEMSMLIELILKFGAEHGVVFHDEAEAA